MIFSRRFQRVFLMVFVCSFFFAIGAAYPSEKTSRVFDLWEELPGGAGVNEVSNLIRVPLVRQSTGYTCGVSALQSVLGYYGKDVRTDKLTRALNSRPETGTDYRNILRYVVNQGFRVQMRTGMSLPQLERLIDARKPVIAVIQAWRNRSVPDWPNDWADGHYVVVVGYDNDNFYFMDPATLGNYTYIPRDEFLNRWHDVDQRDQKLIHAAIVIDGRKPVFNPDNIERMD